MSCFLVTTEEKESTAAHVLTLVYPGSLPSHPRSGHTLRWVEQSSGRSGHTQLGGTVWCQEWTVLVGWNSPVVGVDSLGWVEQSGARSGQSWLGGTVPW